MDPKFKFNWDSDTHVWVAASEDVPGLVLKSPSRAELAKRLWYAAQELQELNDSQRAQQNVEDNAEDGPSITPAEL